MATREVKELRNTVDRKMAKLWEDITNIQIYSRPPHGKCRVLNLFVDPDTGKLNIIYDDKPAP